MAYIYFISTGKNRGFNVLLFYGLFLSPGPVVQPNPNFPLLPHVRHPVNLNFIQQKKWTCISLLIRILVRNIAKQNSLLFASFDHKSFFNDFFFIFVQFCLITLICDTNVKYINTPIFEGVQKSVFISRVK